MGEKQELERWAVIEFAKLFSAQAKRGVLELQELLDPPSPDTRCSLNGESVYIEVAHVYGTEIDAKALLGRTGMASPDAKQHKANSLIHLGARVIRPLNMILEIKATKSYDKSPVWLLVRSAFPAMSLDDFASFYRNEIKVPQVHPFDEIWVLCGITAESGAIRLI